jgi:hypothetical protein
MPIHGPRRPFTEKGIAEAPREPGVFILWDREEAIYIARTAATLHASLAEHYRGVYGECTQFATQYSFEAMAEPASREQELIEEFARAHGRIPRCQTAARRGR